MIGLMFANCIQLRTVGNINSQKAVNANQLRSSVWLCSMKSDAITEDDDDVCMDF